MSSSSFCAKRSSNILCDPISEDSGWFDDSGSEWSANNTLTFFFLIVSLIFNNKF